MSRRLFAPELSAGAPLPTEGEIELSSCNNFWGGVCNAAVNILLGELVTSGHPALGALAREPFFTVEASFYPSKPTGLLTCAARMLRRHFRATVGVSANNAWATSSGRGARLPLDSMPVNLSSSSRKRASVGRCPESSGRQPCMVATTRGLQQEPQRRWDQQRRSVAMGPLSDPQMGVGFRPWKRGPAISDAR